MSAADGATPANAEAVQTRLQFTGTGAAYFRIWIVHTLLTILTLGVYSAWAKVRKARWFSQHTRLLGDSFDYHGRPSRILVGRLLALVLLFAYAHSGEWSRMAGLATLGTLFAAGPLLLGSALRFRSRNTSWRGMRFSFDAPPRELYVTCLPFLVALSASSLWVLVGPGRDGPKWLVLLSVLAFPAAHAAVKSLQHRRTRFANLQFNMRPVTAAFYGLYGKVVLLGVAIGALLHPLTSLSSTPAASAAILNIVALLTLYLLAWPYVATRMQQLVWSRTSCGDITFQVHIRGLELWALLVRNMLLIVLTLGLYWPFAAVAITRYRIQAMVLESRTPFPEATMQAGTAPVSAVGDAASDFFGLDIGW